MSRLFLEKIDKGTVIGVNNYFCSIDVWGEISEGEDDCAEFELNGWPFPFGGGTNSGPISDDTISFASSIVFGILLHERSTH